MSFKHTINFINDEILFLEHESAVTDTSLSEIFEALRPNKYNSIDNVCEIDIFEIAPCYVALHTNMPYIEAHRLFDKLKDSVTEHGIDYINKMLIAIEQEQEDNPKEKLSAKLLLSVLKKKYPVEEYNALTKLYKNNSDILKKLLDFWSEFSLLKDLATNFDRYVSTENLPTSDKTLKTIRREFIYDHVNVNSIMDFLMNINSDCTEKKKQIRTKERNLSRRLKDYKDALALINSDSVFTSKTFEAISKILGPTGLGSVFIDEYNEALKEQFQTLQTKYEVLNNNSKTKITALFNDYNLDFSLVTPKTKEYILSKSSEELELTLKEISALGVTSLEDYTYLIIHSNYKIVSEINTAITEGELSKNFVLTHLNILSLSKEDEIYYKHYLRVKTLLNEHKLNLKLFGIDCIVYITPLDILNKNLNVLDNYNLLGCLKNSTDYSFFKAPDLEKRIDILLELGLENILVNNMDLLNYEYSRLMRLYVYKSLGETNITNEFVMEVLSTTEPIVPDEDLADYITNGVTYEIPESLANADTYSEIPNNSKDRTIKYNDVIFSRNRVLRNQAYLQDLPLDAIYKDYYSYILNGIYSYDELEIIKSKYKSNDDNIRMT